MAEVKKLKKGFDINLKGKPEKKSGGEISSDTYAIQPPDFIGNYRPKVLVDVGDNVKAGTPLYYDKLNKDVMYTAPVSGEVVDIVRGHKRRLLEIKVLADKNQEYEKFKSFSSQEIKQADRATIQDILIKSGVWPNIVQRPFGVIARPEDTPKNIFISGFDTHPLAPDYNFLMQGQEENFQAGLNALQLFTSGNIHLSVSGDKEIAPAFQKAEGVELHKFSGPHPAGNVGVQIHHIDPLSKGDVVWTSTPMGVAQIGKLLLEGYYDSTRTIALTGSEVKEPQYYQVKMGIPMKKIVEDKLKNDHVRYISGNVLTGTNTGPEGHLGFYNHQVSIIPEGDYYEFLGWMKPTTEKLSFHRALGLLSFMNPKKEFVLDTNKRGEERAFVQTGEFEKVLPMDIFPMHLLKAIMAEDYDEMEALGLLEVVEEDFALCEFIDVSKHPIQELIRDGLNMLQEA